MAAKNSVVILTGDVHFGRIAICELTPGRDIVEVVAFTPRTRGTGPAEQVEAGSRLVPGRGDERGRTPPDPDRRRVPVERQPLLDGRVHPVQARTFVCMVRAWPVETNGLQPVPSHVFEHTIS